MCVSVRLCVCGSNERPAMQSHGARKWRGENDLLDGERVRLTSWGQSTGVREVDHSCLGGKLGSG